MRAIANIVGLSIILVCLATTACRTASSSESTEIRAQKSATLIAWLNERQLPTDENLTNQADDFQPAICAELLARHQVKFLLSELNISNTPDGNEWLVSDVLYCIDDKRVYDAFVTRLGDKEDRESYYIALYLAQRGNMKALAILNRHYFQYPVASFEWEEAVVAFGKFKYMPAASNVADTLNAANLGLASTACDTLQKMFPDSPRKFISPSEAENYYKKRLNDSDL